VPAEDRCASARHHPMTRLFGADDGASISSAVSATGHSRLSQPVLSAN